jgi:hypothetical protein
MHPVDLAAPTKVVPLPPSPGQVIIITGSGDQAFAAGADIKEMATVTYADVSHAVVLLPRQRQPMVNWGCESAHQPLPCVPPPSRPTTIAYSTAGRRCEREPPAHAPCLSPCQRLICCTQLCLSAK